MPKLSSGLPYCSCKLMLYGPSGSGKTGAFAALANAGYKVRILDFDRGLDPLSTYVKPEFKQNVSFATCTDAMKPMGAGKPVPKGVPTAFARAMQRLDRWKDADEDLGPVSSWGPDTVLGWDSLTFSGDAALRIVLARNGRSGETPYHTDYGEAMEMQERVLQLLYSDEIKCHVIVTAHFRFLEDDTASQAFDEKGNLLPKPQMAYPSALGKKLPPKIGRYFNTMLVTKTIGNRRVISSMPEANVMVKSPVPLPPQLPIATGLLTVFEALGYKL